MATRNADQMKDLGYTQSANHLPNSAIEALLQKHNIESFDKVVEGEELPKYWLETCSAHTAANLSVAIVADPEAWLAKFQTPGGSVPRVPDILTIWMNTPQRAAEILKATGIDPRTLEFMANEVRSIFPYCVKHVFGILASYIAQSSFDYVRTAVLTGYGVQLGLTKDFVTGEAIGHFVGAYDYNQATDEIVYVDPAPYRHPDGNWWAARMGREEYVQTVSDGVVVYTGEA